MTIDRLLANSGYGSRTVVRKMIRDKKVSIAGVVVTDPSLDLNDSEINNVEITGMSAQIKTNLHFILYKPTGVITALEDKRHETVAKFFPQNLLTTGIFPVGRLDIDTTGLLLFTNDGTLCHRLTNPKWHVDKDYYFEVSEKYLDNDDVQKLKEGLVLDDGTLCKSANLQLLSTYSGILTIQEGKYHQVKRMMKALGGTITVLERRRMGPVVLGNDLTPGEYRELTEEETELLYKAVGLK